jgi:hypothetical protein
MISRGDFRMMIDNSNRVQAVGTTLLCIIERSLPRRKTFSPALTAAPMPGCWLQQVEAARVLGAHLHSDSRCVGNPPAYAIKKAWPMCGICRRAKKGQG